MLTRIHTQRQRWRQALSQQTANWIPRLRIISLALLAGLTTGALLLPGGGFDWYCCYSKYAFDPFLNLRPPWMSLILQPFALLPASLLWFTLFNALLVGASLLLVELPHPLLVLTLPVFWLLYYGQVDAIMLLGALLGWRAVSKGQPYLLGLSLLLLTIKPHIGLPLALLYFCWGKSWKTLIVPLVVLALSLVVFGFWPAAYLKSGFSQSLDSFTSQTVNISLWPWSLAAVPLLIWRWRSISRRSQAVGILAAASLIMPYSPVYSLIVLLFMSSAQPLLALLMLPAWGGRSAARFAGIAFALGVLAWALFAGTRPAKNKIPG